MAPIFIYKKHRHTANPNIKHNSNRHIINNRMKRIKRSESCDPNKTNKTKYKLKDKLSIYAYSNSGQINSNANKRKLVHAKSIPIPQNIFSSELCVYQTEETDEFNLEYLTQIIHFDQNTFRLSHLPFNHTKENKLENTNIKLNINAIGLILSLPIDCILVCHSYTIRFMYSI